MIFPWQTSLWQTLSQAKQANRLAHAFLFSGAVGVGKLTFAEHFLQALLCQQLNRVGEACQTCHACRLISNNTHPNVLRVHPEKAGQAIKVDQVRAITDFVQHSSLQGEYRSVLIHPAHKMNAQAANALLKTIEEPPLGAMFILISEQPSLLPATIRSRCQHLHFPKPKPAQALSWLQAQENNFSAETARLLLKLAQGAPLTALQLAQEESQSDRQTCLQALCSLGKRQSDPLTVAADLQEKEALPLIDFILSWMMDLLRLQLKGRPEDITNEDYLASLTECTQHTELSKNVAFLTYLQQIRGHLLTGINLNKLLLMESLFIRWRECYCRVG